MYLPPQSHRALGSGFPLNLCRLLFTFLSGTSRAVCARTPRSVPFGIHGKRSLNHSVSSMTSCIFCDIINHRVAAEILYENDCSIAILDVNPIHYGHALILPKHHYPDFLALPRTELGGIMEAAHVVARALVQAYKLEGFNFFSNNGVIAGQSVFHFHLHVTPRFPNDEISFRLKLKKYEEGKMREAANVIRAQIQSSLE
jgi:histidine triad (HIT) family protein